MKSIKIIPSIIMLAFLAFTIQLKAQANIDQINYPSNISSSEFAITNQKFFQNNPNNGGVKIEQIGNSNSAHVHDAHANLVSNISVTQKGLSNEATIKNLGKYTDLLSVQLGKSNLQDITLYYDNVDHSSIQNGINNKIINKSYSQTATYEFYQKGNDISLTNYDFSPNSPGLMVLQKGTNMQVYIKTVKK